MSSSTSGLAAHSPSYSATHSSSALSSSSISSPNFIASLRQQQSKSYHHMKLNTNAASVPAFVNISTPSTTICSPQTITPKSTTTIVGCSSPLLLSTQTALSSPSTSIIHSPISSCNIRSPQILLTQQKQQAMPTQHFNSVAVGCLNSATLKQLDLNTTIVKEADETLLNLGCSSTGIGHPDEIRATSVKAESCYENLSSESDFDEDEIFFKTSPQLTLSANLGT